jgi:F-type H+/Na+-transporting ATPase subunit alpha
VLKQPQYRPVPVEKQVVIIYAVTNGHLDTVDVKHIRKWESDFLDYLEASHGDILKDIRAKKVLDDGITKRLIAAIGAFQKLFAPE